MDLANAINNFYFKEFEQRKAPKKMELSWLTESLWHILAICTFAVGIWYLQWRWFDSLNEDALIFALLLAGAETLAFFGLCLYIYNIWQVRDYKYRSAPKTINECLNLSQEMRDASHGISVDIMITTYNEAVPLVEESVISAKKVTYDHPIDIRVHILDDGKRPQMRRMAKRQAINYITRSDNTGYKAGNICNAFKQTSADFVVICDADTRLEPNFLVRTLGYFKDHKVSWVQTPQWFYDIPEGEMLTQRWTRKYGRVGKWAAHTVEYFAGKICLGKDPFCNESQIFYDVIQRRRNRVNASFCCGAASVHRRAALVDNALREFAEDGFKSDNTDYNIKPFKHHVSEDIYTSIEHHKSNKKWKSVYHPEVLSRMLSPQDIKTFLTQRYKYAAGSLDILLHDNPLKHKGLGFRQKLMYAATFWSYLGCVWTLIFLTAPIFYLFTSISPVMSYTVEFFKHLIPFLILTEVSFMVATWGTSTFKNKAFYISMFALNLRALRDVIKKKEIKFTVTPKFRIRNDSVLQYIWPHLLIIVLTLLGLGYAYYNFFILDNLIFGPNGIVVNSFWAFYNIFVLMQFVLAANWNPSEWDHPVTYSNQSISEVKTA